MERAVFFDRDGTLIHDRHYMADPDQVVLLPGAIELLSRLNAQNFLIVVVSNQSGIQRGLITPDQARAVHERFTALLRDAGIQIAAVLYCPHGPEENCDCRKPKAGLLTQAAGNLRIDLTGSYMVGDKLSDCEAGHRAGCRSILIDWKGQTGPDSINAIGCTRVVHNLEELSKLLSICEIERLRYIGTQS